MRRANSTQTPASVPDQGAFPATSRAITRTRSAASRRPSVPRGYCSTRDVCRKLRISETHYHRLERAGGFSQPRQWGTFAEARDAGLHPGGCGQAAGGAGQGASWPAAVTEHHGRLGAMRCGKCATVAHLDRIACSFHRIYFGLGHRVSPNRSSCNLRCRRTR